MEQESKFNPEEPQPYYSPEELFDEYPTEEIEVERGIMNEWDKAYQRRIEQLTPDEKLLSAEEENELTQTIKEGRRAVTLLKTQGITEKYTKKYHKRVELGQAARDTLVTANLRLAAWFVRETMDFNKQQRLEKGERGKAGKIYENLTKLSGGEHDYGDRLQLATIGLIKAAENYQGGKGRFSTYAMYHMEGELGRALFKKQSPLSVPFGASEGALHLIKRAQMDFEDAGNLEPSYEELAQKLHWPIEKVAFFSDVENASQPVSFELVEEKVAKQLSDEAENKEGDKATSLTDILPDTGVYKSVFDEVALEELGYRLDEVLATFSNYEQRIIEMRYGLDTGEPMTLAEVGHEFNLTRERIRQIEAKILAKLRHPIRIGELRDFYNRVVYEQENPTLGLKTEVSLSEGQEATLGLKKSKPNAYIGPSLFFGSIRPGDLSARKRYTLEEMRKLKKESEGEEKNGNNS